jgi:hypothetical protein
MDTKRVEELVRSFQTYKLSLPQPKRNNFASKAMREDVSDSSKEELVLLANRFREFLRTKKENSRNKSSKMIEKSKGNSSGSSFPRKERQEQEG